MELKETRKPHLAPIPESELWRCQRFFSTERYVGLGKSPKEAWSKAHAQPMQPYPYTRKT